MNSCPQDPEWLEFLDQETTDEVDIMLQAHLDSCRACRSRLHDIAGLAACTTESFGMPEENPSRQFTRTKATLIASVLALLFSISAISPSGRHVLAAVWQTLLFRQVNALQISSAQIDQITSRLSQGGRINIRHYGSVSMTQLGHYQSSVNWTTLQKTNPYVRVWPKAWASPQASVQPSARLQLTLNVQAINQLLRAEGDTTLFPTALNHVPVTVNIPQITMLNWQPASGPNKSAFASLSVSSVPTLVVPKGLDMIRVAQAIQSLPFLPSSVAQQLAAAGNHLSSTLLIPSQEPITHFHIQGDPAVISPTGGSSYQATWIHRHVLYSLSYQSGSQLGLKGFERQVSEWFPTP